VICRIDFFTCKVSRNGLFSLIKRRGSCIIVFSLISDDDDEFWWDGNRSIEDEESDNGRGNGGGANGWESPETVDDCVSKHIKTSGIIIFVWD
jgi:hypothetical protein